MPYIQRGQGGAITGMFANPQDFTSEFLPDDASEVVAFGAPAERVGAVLQGGKADEIATVEAPSLQDQIDALNARLSALEAKAG